MANPKRKHRLNVEGKWFCTDVDDTDGEGCIACNICYTKASAFFGNDDQGNAYVKVQPITEEDIKICQELLEACPVQAIGKNG